MNNLDRSPEEMPSQSVLMRYQSPYPRRTSYAKPDNFEPNTPAKRALIGDQGNLPMHLQEKIKAAPPLNRFCGGKSKPYKK